MSLYPAPSGVAVRMLDLNFRPAYGIPFRDIGDMTGRDFELTTTTEYCIDGAAWRTGGTNGDGATKDAAGDLSLTPYGQGTYRLDILFRCFGADADFESTEILVYHYDGTNLHRFGFRAMSNGGGTNEFQYLNSSAVWTHGSVWDPLWRGARNWFRMTMTVDSDNDQYDRINLNGLSLTDTASNVAANAGAPNLYIQVVSGVVDTKTYYQCVDQLIIDYMG